MKLTNPYTTCDQDLCGRVSADISPECFNYFFRGMFAGARTGIRAALISQFFDALHKHCLKQNLKPVFDPSNESTVAGFLSTLNFDDTATLKDHINRLTAQLAGVKHTAVRPPAKHANLRKTKPTV